LIRSENIRKCVISYGYARMQLMSGKTAEPSDFEKFIFKGPGLPWVTPEKLALVNPKWNYVVTVWY